MGKTQRQREQKTIPLQRISDLRRLRRIDNVPVGEEPEHHTKRPKKR